MLQCGLFLIAYSPLRFWMFKKTFCYDLFFYLKLFFKFLAVHQTKQNAVLLNVNHLSVGWTSPPHLTAQQLYQWGTQYILWVRYILEAFLKRTLVPLSWGPVSNKPINLLQIFCWQQVCGEYGRGNCVKTGACWCHQDPPLPSPISFPTHPFPVYKLLHSCSPSAFTARFPLLLEIAHRSNRMPALLPYAVANLKCLRVAQCAFLLIVFLQQQNCVRVCTISAGVWLFSESGWDTNSAIQPSAEAEVPVGQRPIQHWVGRRLEHSLP